MSYSEGLVESLLPSVWDRTYAWGVYDPSAPDPDMPRAKYKSPKEATTFWTHLIDARRAWESAPVLMPERRALFLHYALGWSAEEIGYNQGVSARTINKRLAKGLDTMTRWLNERGVILL